MAVDISSSANDLLDSWRVAMKAQGLSPRTIDERLRVMRSISATMDVEPDRLTADQILHWLADKPTAITRWTYFTSIRAFFRWLEVTQRIEINPTLMISPPKRPKYLPRPVAEVHVQTVLTHPLRPLTRKMILLAAYAGLRESEIAKIHGNDYDPATGVLTVTGKGGTTKMVPLHTDLQVELIDMPRRHWWFDSPYRPGPMTGRSVGQAIKRAFRKHDIVMSAHQLRHSFGTNLVEAGVNLRVAQELMRHESIASTALYTQVSITQKQTAVNQLEVPHREGAKA